MNINKQQQTTQSVRHMLGLNVNQRDKLKALAKDNRITQGEVVEILLDNIDMSKMKPHFEAQAKLSGRASRSELIKKMKTLNADQLAAIEAIIGK